MSDLLIKNMKITDRPIKLVLYPNGDVDHLTEDNRYETIAKAVEVKPHGRCIDADRLADDFHAWLVTTSPCMQKSVADAMVETVRTAARIAPTMLEASDNICPEDDDDHTYEMQSDMRDYCERYEPTYNPEDGSM